MFNVALVGKDALIARLDSMPVAVQTVLKAKVTSLAIQLRAHIQDDKLSGQVLKIRTGALRASINFDAPIVDGASVMARVFSSGDVKYARFWEFGFHGTESVRQHIRTVAFGKSVAPYSVGPFTRRVDQAARPFMRPALAEMASQISAELKQAVVEGMQKGAPA